MKLTDEGLRKTLFKVWQLGQTYWQQADSDSYKQQDKSDETRKKYLALVEETSALLAHPDHSGDGSEKLDMSLEARLADAEADVARLHKDKMDLWMQLHGYSPVPQDGDERRDNFDVLIKQLATEYALDRTAAGGWIFENHNLFKFVYAALASNKAAAVAVGEPTQEIWEYSFIHNSALGRPDEKVGPCLTYNKDQAFGVGCIEQRLISAPAPMASAEEAIAQATALSFINQFEIVGDNNDSRDPTDEEKFILREFILQLFDDTTPPAPIASASEMPVSKGIEQAFSSAAMSRRDELELPGATVYIERFISALGMLLRKTPPREMCEQWLNHESEELQSFAVSNARIYWMTGIGAIEAAQVLADNPDEGEAHEGYTSDYSRANHPAAAQPSRAEVLEEAAQALAEAQFFEAYEVVYRMMKDKP
jgi:hypothetical protein